MQPLSGPTEKGRASNSAVSGDRDVIAGARTATAGGRPQPGLEGGCREKSPSSLTSTDVTERGVSTLPHVHYVRVRFAT